MRINPEWSLRVSLGVMYLYSGIDLVQHPTAWHWALPYWLKQFIGNFLELNTYLRLQGAVEIIFALVLLAWFLKPVFVTWVAALSTLEFAVILVLAFIPWSEAIFLITFRDIGLFGASLALLAIALQKQNGGFRN